MQVFVFYIQTNSLKNLSLRVSNRGPQSQRKKSYLVIRWEELSDVSKIITL